MRENQRLDGGRRRTAAAFPFQLTGFWRADVVDRTLPEWVAATLEEAGFTIVLHAWDFRPGQNFVERMDAAMRESERRPQPFSAVTPVATHGGAAALSEGCESDSAGGPDAAGIEPRSADAPAPRRLSRHDPAVCKSQLRRYTVRPWPDASIAAARTTTRPQPVAIADRSSRQPRPSASSGRW
jgi:TIR domain